MYSVLRDLSQHLKFEKFLPKKNLNLLLGLKSVSSYGNTEHSLREGSGEASGLHGLHHLSDPDTKPASFIVI